MWEGGGSRILPATSSNLYNATYVSSPHTAPLSPPQTFPPRPQSHSLQPRQQRNRPYLDMTTYTILYNVRKHVHHTNKNTHARHFVCTPRQSRARHHHTFRKHLGSRQARLAPTASSTLSGLCALFHVSAVRAELRSRNHSWRRAASLGGRQGLCIRCSPG